MRLINADAFQAEGRKLYREAGWDLREVHYSQLDTECNIDMMPTIEAVPLEDYQSMEQTVYKLTQAIAEAEPTKHGWWIYDDEAYPGGNPYGHYDCDQCGESVPHKTKFCPNCGAKMDLTE